MRVPVQMFFKVFNGYRPPMPEGTPKGMKDLMEACWSHNPAERPSFRFITKALQRLIIEVRANGCFHSNVLAVAGPDRPTGT